MLVKRLYIFFISIMFIYLSIGLTSECNAESRIIRYTVNGVGFGDFITDQYIQVNPGDVVQIFGAYASGHSPTGAPPPAYGIRDTGYNGLSVVGEQAPNTLYYWWYHTFTATSSYNGLVFRPYDFWQYYPTVTVAVGKQIQSITFNSLDTKTYGDVPFSLTAGASSNLPISYTSSNTNVATISGSTVTIIAPGTTIITASQSGNNSYLAASDVQQTLTVNKKSQNISFSKPADQIYGNDPFTLNASASSELAVTYTSSDTNVATISGSSVTILAPGTTTITASQSGNSYYMAASDVQQVLTVTKKSQIISFIQPTEQVYGNHSFELNASASSSLPVTFTSSDVSVASISGSSITINGSGTTQITASQIGNINYFAADDVIRTLTVTPAMLTISGVFYVNDKIYNGTNEAEISGHSLILSGAIGNDIVTITPHAVFSDSAVGSNKVVSLNSQSEVNSQNYYLSLVNAPITTADIQAKSLAVSGCSVAVRLYDGTTLASITGGTLVGVVESENVVLTYSAVGSFDTKNVGTSKSVTTLMELTGTAISNYTLTQPTLTGTITAKPLTVSGAAVISKVYDGTTSAAITGAALEGTIAGDNVILTGASSGSFTSKNVNTGISVTPLFSLSGGDAANYTLQLPSLTGEIAQKPLVITADSKNKTPDGTTFGAFTASYNSFASGESVSNLSGTLQFGGNAVSATAAGVYTITAGGLSSTNYDITYVDGTLTIAAISSRGSSSSNANNPATTSTTTVNGQQASVMTLNPQAVTQMLSQSLSQIQNLNPSQNQNQANTGTAGSNGPEITLQFTNPQPVNVATLDGQILQTLSSQNASLVMKTQHASYSVPAAQIDLAGAAQQLGPDVPAAAVKVEITIAEPTAAQAKIVEDSSVKSGFQVVVPPVDFSITCSYGDKSVEVSGFNSYVSRMVAIPQNVDVGKVSTAVVVRQDGTWYHVPTRIVTIDGKYYAQINSLSNSTYVMIWNPVTFKDMEKHWAKEAVNDLGSRFVVSGYGNDIFAPERSITRSEFAAILMKGLGLSPAGGSSNFKDTKTKDWYFGYVNTAFNYKLISGYHNQTFRPSDRITREQAMVMIARAIKITGLEVDLKDGETATILAKYKDASAVQSYAREGIATCIKAGIVSGRNDGTLGANASITRAEVAVIIRNLLIKSDLI